MTAMQHKCIARHSQAAHSGVAGTKFEVGILAGAGIHIILIEAIESFQVGLVHPHIAAKKALGASADRTAEEEGEPDGSFQLGKRTGE